MSLNATIAQLNQQNEDIARIRRDLKKDQIQAVAFVVGAAVGFATVTVIKFKTLKK